MIKFFIKIIVIIIFLFLSFACSIITMMLVFGGDYVIPVNDEYKMMRIYGDAILLASEKDGIVVGPKIDGYLIYNGYIFGHVSHERLPKEDKEYSTPGYFIVNLIDDSVLQGLDETEYTAELIKRKIQTNKKLHKPYIFDEYFKGGVVKNTSVN